MSTQELTKTVEFYTLTPTQQWGENVFNMPEYSLQIPQIQKVVARCLSPFSENVTMSDGQRADERLKLFQDGGEPYSPMDSQHKSRFETAVYRIVAAHCFQFFTPEGKVKPGKENEWFNLVELVPELTRILSDRADTDRTSLISMVQEDYALNLIGASLHLSQNPNASMKFLVGIGGSDTEFTSNRFEAYSLPALSIAEALGNFYAKRDVAKLQDAAFRKMLPTLSFEGLNPEEIKEYKRDLAKSINPQQILTQEEVHAVRGRYAIRTAPLQVEFKFAHNAAQAVNTNMDRDKIQYRTQENMNALKQFVHDYYPTLENSVRYALDRPWDQHNTYGKVILEYMARLLRTSTDPVIQKTLLTLQARGNNHGGLDGAERAAEYAADHPVVFEDRINLPTTHTFDDAESPKPEILITIGGRSERHFCAIRNHLSKVANAEGLREFVLAKAQQTANDQEKRELDRMAQAIYRWEQMVDHKRETYAHGGNVIRPDLPIHEIPLITPVGEVPTYYVTQYDSKKGATTLTAQIADVKRELEELLTQKIIVKSDQDSSRMRELIEKITEAQRVIYDLSTLRFMQQRRRNTQ